MTKASASSHKRTIAVVATLFGHASVLALIGLSAPRVRIHAPPHPLISIWLMPRHTSNSSSTPPYINARAAAVILTAHRQAPLTARGVPTSLLPLAATAIPLSPEARPASPQANLGSTQIGVGGPVDGVRGALRTGLGCDFAAGLHLTHEEKDRCAQHMGEEAHQGPKFIDPIPMEKRAYYDAVQAATQASRRPDQPLYKDANGNNRSWGGPPAPGCALRPHYRPGASFSDKIKATGMIAIPLGPLSCGVLLPQGSMTPEIRIAAP